jgi:hypothetical protein
MPREAFEPKTPVSEQAEAVHALESGLTVIGHTLVIQYNSFSS